MIVFAAATGVQAAAGLAAALAAACVLVLRDSRRRTAAMPVALVLAALALYAVAEGQLRDALSGRLTLAAAGLGAGLVGLAVLGSVFRRWPAAFVVAAVAALPARIPIDIGGESAILLLPLYAVIAGGVVARLSGREAVAAEAARRSTTLEKVLACVVVLYAAQALYSTDVEAAAKDIAFFYVPFAVLLRLLLDAPWSRRLVMVVLGTLAGLALAFAAIGLFQYATRTTLLSNEKVLLANELKPYFRVNSLFYDPNIYGRFIALTMVLLTAAMLWTRERRTLIACAAGLAVLWAGLVPSLSESSFAALAVGLAVLAGLRWAWRPVLLAGGCLIAAAVAVTLIAPGAVGMETHSFDKLNESTSGRAELIRGGVEMAVDRPVGGYGSGSFAERYRDRENLLSPRSPAESHTIPVTVAAEQGVIGLVAYIALLVAAFTLVLRRVDRLGARAAVAAAFAALVVHTLVYASFLEDPITWALLAAAVALRRDGVAGSPAPADAARPAGRTATVAT
jgi:putative inorganic carbon (HCO3(-)) transporter